MQMVQTRGGGNRNHGVGEGSSGGGAHRNEERAPSPPPPPPPPYTVDVFSRSFWGANETWSKCSEIWNLPYATSSTTPAVGITREVAK